MTQHVIIVGAPRSGTNMLRDVLTSAPGVSTWPCDEINFVWKHQNLDIDHDEIPADRAPRVSTYLRGQFDARAAKDRADVVVEKTCATSLRVPFVVGAPGGEVHLHPARRSRRDGLDDEAVER